VMLVGRSRESLVRALARLKAAPDCTGMVVADVADSKDTQRYVEETVSRWGKIDVLFSHAGISGVIAPITEYPEEVFDSVMAINVRGSFLACKYVIPRMNEGGSIIITSSIMGVTADPGVCAYAVSKHALIGLMRTVAKEAAPRGIRVNVLAPGPIDNSFQSDIEKRLSDIVGEDGTDFLNKVIPLGRHGQAEEIAPNGAFSRLRREQFFHGQCLHGRWGNEYIAQENQSHLPLTDLYPWGTVCTSRPKKKRFFRVASQKLNHDPDRGVDGL
jgi:NAD(P)-dependent dehydrogenase (short-subunit alcohol dehydrogenase family)